MHMFPPLEATSLTFQLAPLEQILIDFLVVALRIFCSLLLGCGRFPSGDFVVRGIGSGRLCGFPCFFPFGDFRLRRDDPLRIEERQDVAIARVHLSDPLVEAVCQPDPDRTPNHLHMRLQLVFPQLVIDVLQLERLHLLSVRVPIDRISVALKATLLVDDTSVVKTELRRFQQKSERRSFRNVDSLRACLSAASPSSLK